MPKLSVTIITSNEEADIAAAIDSVAWADEVVLVDSHSTDRTVDVARGARVPVVVIVRDWPGYVEQKNFAAAQAAHDWILSLDADERVSPELARDVRRALEAPQHAAFEVPRLTWHLGRWIRGTDWYPDHQTRLYDRRRARWTGQYVHEAVAVDGTRGRLAGHLEHFAYRDIADHLETIDRYTTLAARQMLEAGRRASPWHLAFHGPLAFLRNYVARRGFTLGRVGLIVSVMNAYYVFLKFAKLWELQAAPPARPADDTPPV
ncbi:MAG: glycosyltransferase family 2 protein [Vicinamibacterales bacterium]